MAKSKDTSAVEAPAPEVKFNIFDIENINARYVPIHPTKFVELPTWVELANTDSEEFAMAVMQMQKKAKAAVPLQNNDEEMDRAYLRNEHELIGRCIVAWDEVQFGVFSKQAAVELMMNPKMQWLFVQLKTFLDRRENFYKA